MRCVHVTNQPHERVRIDIMNLDLVFFRLAQIMGEHWGEIITKIKCYEFSCSGFLTISRFLQGIIMEHIGKTISLDCKLQVQSICSIRNLSGNWDFVRLPQTTEHKSMRRNTSITRNQHYIAQLLISEKMIHTLEGLWGMARINKSFFILIFHFVRFLKREKKVFNFKPESIIFPQ